MEGCSGNTTGSAEAPAAAGDAEPLVPPLVRQFLRHEYTDVDAALPGLLEVLFSVGASEYAGKNARFDLQSGLFRR